MRSTLIDIAREAGVSTATVDRVLNNRSGARSRTRDIVIETARRLGYIAEGPGGTPAAPAAYAGDVVRLDFALPEGHNAFITALHRQIEAQARTRPDLDVRIQVIEGFNPDTLARTLRDLRNQIAFLTSEDNHVCSRPR